MATAEKFLAISYAKSIIVKMGDDLVRVVGVRDSLTGVRLDLETSQGHIRTVSYPVAGFQAPQVVHRKIDEALKKLRDGRVITQSLICGEEEERRRLERRNRPLTARFA